MRALALALIVLAPATLSACTRTDALEARVAKLERESAAPKPAPVAPDSSKPRDSRPRCPETTDESVAKETRTPFPVAFEVGASQFAAGDEIRITEVVGSRAVFGVEGIYRIRGEYTLQSADEASVAVTVTATEKGFGCTTSNGSNTARITRGHGTFEIAMRVTYEGYPHVYFARTPEKSYGVYFGKGEYLRRAN